MLGKLSLTKKPKKKKKKKKKEKPTQLFLAGER
jgi:hypothetical protein